MHNEEVKFTLEEKDEIQKIILDSLFYRELDNRIIELEKKKGKINRPLDPISKYVIREVISNEIMDVVWNDYFYYYTAFEAIDGFDTTLGGTGGATIDPDGLYLDTGATSGGSSTIQKSPNPNLSAVIEIFNSLSINKVQKFRTSFGLNSTTSQTVYMLRGASIGSGYPYYGFKVINSSLCSVSRDNGTDGETTAFLATLVNSTAYLVEAHYFPQQRIDFYLRDNGTNELQFKGSLTSGLPKSTNQNDNSMFEYFISSQANGNKAVGISYFEYIQDK